MSPNIQDAKCVLVVGSTAGIGRELALAIHDLPSQPRVIVTGRRRERLDELATKSTRIEGIQIDVNAGRATLKGFADEVITKYPEVSLATPSRLQAMHLIVRSCSWMQSYSPPVFSIPSNLTNQLQLTWIVSTCCNYTFLSQILLRR